MARRDTLRLSAHQFVETYRDGCGRAFIAYSSGASVFIRDPKELRRFLKISKGLPMRESLESWLASLAAMDQERSAKRTATDASEHDSAVSVTEPFTSEASAGQAAPSLSQELLATGWGPEVHQATEAEPDDDEGKAPALEAPSEPDSGSWDPPALSTEVDAIDNDIDNDPTANTKVII